MTNPLDGIALHAYCRRLALHPDARDVLAAIRSAPPSRTPQTRRGNVAVWYPSKKMGRIIKAESATVEFAFLLEAEHDDAVLEFYDQPPPIPLDYRDARGRLQRTLHTAEVDQGDVPGARRFGDGVSRHGLLSIVVHDVVPPVADHQLRRPRRSRRRRH